MLLASPAAERGSHMTTEPPDAQERETGPRNDAGRFFPSWFSKPQYVSTIALLAGLLVVGAVAVYLWTSDGGSDRPATAAVPERGVACPALREAFEQSKAGNSAAFRELVDEAAQAGEESLDRSGQVFGRPEEIALELEYAIGAGNSPATDVSTLLEDARDVCTRLGRWQPAS
jgi:hypothetical protein